MAVFHIFKIVQMALNRLTHHYLMTKTHDNEEEEPIHSVKPHFTNERQVQEKY